MYGVHNAETLEKLVKTGHVLHSQQSLFENLFAGQTAAAYKIYSQMHNACSIQHYAISSLLYLCKLKINILQFTINLFHNYKYMPRQ